MARITGEDHQALAELLVYRVDKVEGKVDDTTKVVAGMDAKIDTLIEHVEAHTLRFDRHLEEHARPAPKAWEQPRWLNSVALLILAFAAWVAAAGRVLSEKVFAVFSHFFGG